MTVSLKNIFLGVLVAATIIIAVCAAFFPSHPPLPITTNAINAPDAYMEQVQALIMDKDGKLNMKIEAPKLVHFTKDDMTDLTAPIITLYRQSPMPWFISAKFAKATQGVENVNFQQNVVIRHSTDVETPETIIKTAALMVHPNAKTAETKELITLLQPNLTVKSIGMFANMHSGDIKLLSQPRGEYVPSS